MVAESAKSGLWNKPSPPPPTTTCTLSGSKKDQALDVNDFFNEYHVTCASLKLTI